MKKDFFESINAKCLKIVQKYLCKIFEKIYKNIRKNLKIKKKLKNHCLNVATFKTPKLKQKQTT